MTTTSNFGWKALFVTGLRAWFGRHESNVEDRLIARTVWLSLLIAALHSGLDYPLRTSANSSVFALLFAVALSHAWPRQTNRSTPRVAPGLTLVEPHREPDTGGLPRIPR
jgi:hypothetical protein